jgi:hypothetical protein
MDGDSRPEEDGCDDPDVGVGVLRREIETKDSIIRELRDRIGELQSKLKEEQRTREVGIIVISIHLHVETDREKNILTRRQ